MFNNETMIPHMMKKKVYKDTNIFLVNHLSHVNFGKNPFFRITKTRIRQQYIKSLNFWHGQS